MSLIGMLVNYVYDKQFYIFEFSWNKLYNLFYKRNIILLEGKKSSVTSAYTLTNSIYWKQLDISVPVGYGQSDNIEVFVGGIRLKKKPYNLYNVSNGPDSPAADDRLDAEFSVNGTTKQVRLTEAVPFGTTVTVVKRLGTDWDRLVNIQDDNSKIAKFLKSTPGISYKAVTKSE
jgi:hypothetical protein